ncbi:MAG: DnaA ATPase domain-containing protein [Gemmatimonadales bacterium]
MTVELNPQLTFATLVHGDCNQVAVSAGQSVVRDLGNVYNPLLIHGPPSTGKTHLLMAIGNEAKATDEGVIVEYVTLDDFAGSYRSAAGAGQLEAFRNRFNDVDLLLIDDLHVIAERQDCQDELERLVMQLHERGQQLVLVADALPGELPAMTKALAGALTSGLVVDVAEPGRVERRQIVQRKAMERKSELPPGVIDVLANPDIGDLRTLLGYLHRIVAFQAVSSEPITPEVALEVVRGRVSAPFRQRTEAGSGSLGEFDSFLGNVSATVSRQVQAWGELIDREITRWRERGFATGALEQAATGAAVSEYPRIIADFQRKVQELVELESRAAEIDAAARGHSCFRDPARIDDAQLLVAELRRYGRVALPGPSSDWVLGRFVEGSENSDALAVVRSVMENPADYSNPLIIVGPVGVGKSHLLHGVANALLAFGEGGVACMAAHDFVQHAQKAEQTDAAEVFLFRYARADAILLDDLHLADQSPGSRLIAELFERLIASHKQIVLTLRVEPDQLEDPYLGPILQRGSVIRLGLPGRRMRRDLAEALLGRGGEPVDEDLLDYVADRQATSMREVTTLAQRILEEARKRGQPLSSALAREVAEGKTRRRRSTGVRASGVLVSPLVGIKSAEKMVWTWPNLADRVIEEID